MALINAFSSLRLFFTLSALMLAAFILGGVIPQGASPQAYHDMFGRVGGAWVVRLRFDNVFSSLWFLFLMGGGALNILACTVKQWKLLKPRPGVFLSHLGVMLLFLGGAVHGVFAVRGILALHEGEAKGEFAGNSGGPVALPFQVLLKDFNIRYYDEEKHFIHAYKTAGDGDLETGYLLESVEAVPGTDAHFGSAAGDLSILKFYPNFSIGDSGPVTVDESRENPALAVRLKDEKTGQKSPATGHRSKAAAAKAGYLFANHPDFHGVPEMNGIRYVYEYRPGRIKQFESRIAVLEDGAEKMEKVISVNSPASYKGYKFYQSGYDAKNPGFSSIQVADDPSVAVIYAGFAFMMIGLTWAFWKEMAVNSNCNSDTGVNPPSSPFKKGGKRGIFS